MKGWLRVLCHRMASFRLGQIVRLGQTDRQTDRITLLSVEALLMPTIRNFVSTTRDEG